MFRKLFRLLRKSRFHYTPIIEVLIYRERILHNFRTFQKEFKNLAIAPVLKSNAYGHGLIEIARILQDENIPFLCVDSYYEALILRNEKIQMPILILGFSLLENIRQNKFHNVSFSILSLDELKILSEKLDTPRNFHLEIDTGMHRHGILLNEVDKAIEIIRKNSNIRIEGIFSHLADADNAKSKLTKKQIKLWNEVSQKIKNQIPRIKYFHLAATAGSYYSSEIEANVMRLGLGLYGIDVNPNRQLNLQPALEMRSQITSLRRIEASESVGYNATFKNEYPMLIATIPAGYNEGIDRRLSNGSFVYVKGIPCPILGRVSMNITSIDVPKIPEVKIGDPVVIFNADKSTLNSVQKIAEECGTIPYDILVHIPASLRRKVV